MKAPLLGVDPKAVHQILKLEGLRLSRKIRWRLEVPKLEAVEPTAPNQARCMDFACQRLANRRQARILAVLDCCTRECLLLKAAPSFPAFEVQRELEWLFLVHDKPGRIVSDNGPEVRALKLPEGVEAGFIQPGKPWHNGQAESFFDKLRRTEISTSGAELQHSRTDY